jgi:hypothetical protein
MSDNNEKFDSEENIDREARKLLNPIHLTPRLPAKCQPHPCDFAAENLNEKLVLNIVEYKHLPSKSCGV